MTSHVVVLPIKGFATAKGRLSPIVDAATRADLARNMAHHVLRQLDGLAVAVVCDDPEVAALGQSFGAEVVADPGLGLNAALSAAISMLAQRGVARVTVVHADLPQATPLLPILESVKLQRGEVLCIPDRHFDGTNVMSIPTDIPFALHYGARSFGLHLDEANRHGLRVIVIRNRGYGHDVDTPSDLEN